MTAVHILDIVSRWVGLGSPYCLRRPSETRAPMPPTRDSSSLASFCGPSALASRLLVKWALADRSHTSRFLDHKEPSISIYLGRWRRAPAARIDQGSPVASGVQVLITAARPQPRVVLIPAAPSSQRNQPDHVIRQLMQCRTRRHLLVARVAVQGPCASPSLLSHAAPRRGIFGPMVVVNVPLSQLGHLK